MLRIRLLNVGRGDCILLQFPDKSWAIIDCGEQNFPYEPHNQVVGFLNDEKPSDTPIRFILATHPDSDHDAGIRQLLYLIHRDIHAVYYSGVERRSMTHCGTQLEEEESFVVEARRLLGKKEIRDFRALKEGDVIEFDDTPATDVSIRVLWPSDGFVTLAKECYDLAKQHRLRNNISIVLLIEYAGRTIILPGDIQGEDVCGRVFGTLGNNELDVIKAPHHGAGSSIIPWNVVTYGDRDNFVLISCPSYSEKFPHDKFLSSIPGGHNGWKTRCTGLAGTWHGHQEPVAWPVSAEERSFLLSSMLSYESMRRSFLVIGQRGRTVSLHVNHECCLNNEITVSESGEIKHVEDVRTCDARLQ